MVSHYDYKLRRQVNTKPETPDKENYHEEIQATYIRWSETGRRCDELKQDCNRCTIFQTLGRHKGGGWLKKCHQPEANAQLRERDRELLAQGIAPPNEDLKPDAYRKHAKKWR